MDNTRENQQPLNQTDKECPKCGYANCQIITETTSSGTDFSASQGCCGALLLGPIGILCGACTGGKKIKSKSYWICPNCGKKFKV